jgi:hypothetical protein
MSTRYTYPTNYLNRFRKSFGSGFGTNEEEEKEVPSPTVSVEW